ncbi:retrovirus-related pol polyprotein from transposon TNT 1-94 [Tanacetum coccineum]
MPAGTINESVISEDPPEFTEADNHPALNEPDQTKSNDLFELAEPQNNHIELVNIIGKPLTSITTRSRIRDSDAASASECLYVNFLSEMEPKKLIEALKEEGWIIVMQEELNQFKRNKERIDYEETFAPVARLEAIRIFLGYAAYIGFMVYQMDVKSAFLNGKISEEVYVQQPPRFESCEYPNHVYFKGISICQEKYVKDLLKKYDLADCASVKCPMLPPNNLGPDKLGVSVNETLFKATIWSLMYLTASRPDIQFSICLCARYQANPKESHLVAIKRIFRYLKGTLNLGLWYPKGSGFDLKAYSDLEYAGCNLDRNSTSGEIKSQLADYDVLYDKVPIFCDNTSAIVISNNLMLHSKTKHIDIMYHSIKDHILKGDIELHFVPTNLQLADMFTKPLAEPSFTRLVAKLAEVEEETQTITFSLSWCDKPLSFTQDEFISAIGLPICKDVVPLPPKETSLIPPSGEVNADDTSDKALSRASVQPVTQLKAPTDLKTKRKRIPPSFKPKSPYKVRVILPKKQVTETQHAEVTVATADDTKSLVAFELAEEQVNQPLVAKAKKGMILKG